MGFSFPKGDGKMVAWTAVAPDLCYKLGEADRLQAELQIRA